MENHFLPAFPSSVLPFSLHTAHLSAIHLVLQVTLGLLTSLPINLLPPCSQCSAETDRQTHQSSRLGCPIRCTTPAPGGTDGHESQAQSSCCPQLPGKWIGLSLTWLHIGHHGQAFRRVCNMVPTVVPGATITAVLDHIHMSKRDTPLEQVPLTHHSMAFVRGPRTIRRLLLYG